ncbi:MAG: hypothetical protein B6U94_02790 [Thermofilum sp. ex4484_79]|nr:MAG: hypothetical protein B6U94_02790 [Thermofilum sp. ex4484_79]
MKVEDGDYVLLYSSKRDKFLVKVKKGKILHTRLGYIKLDDVIGSEYGTEVLTNIGKKFKIARPTFLDFLMKFKRKTQVIYPKDLGLILIYSNVFPGAKVVESGTGSGVLTATLANFVRPSGLVISYEIRKEFIDIARKNLEKAGLEKWVILKNKDITEGIDEDDVDSVVLDMASPWLVVDHAYKALKHGGTLTCFVPTYNQVEKMLKILHSSDFIDILLLDGMVRYYEVKPYAIRPKMHMVGHTGFIIVAKKP